MKEGRREEGGGGGRKKGREEKGREEGEEEEGGGRGGGGSIGREPSDARLIQHSHNEHPPPTCGACTCVGCKRGQQQS